MSENLSTLWENTDDCAEHYIRATELYLLSMLSQGFSVIIDRCISEPGHVREVVDGLNLTVKRFLLQLVSTVKFPGEKEYDTQMTMNSGTPTSDISLSQEFQKHLYNTALKHGVIDQER